MQTRSAIVVALLSACGSRDAPSRAPAGTVEIRRGTEVVERVVALDIDVWRWCKPPITSVIARGPRRFVQGACRQLDDETFVLTTPRSGTPTATLSDDTGVLATAAEITTLELTTSDDAVAPLPPLSIEIAGRTSVMLDAATLDDLRPEHRQREGIHLEAVLERAGVPRPRAVIIHGESSYTVDPAWLSQPPLELRLRRNRRGQLRFSHTSDGRELVRISDVNRIEITP